MSRKFNMYEDKLEMIDYPVIDWLEATFNDRGIGHNILLTIISHPDELPTFDEINIVFEGREDENLIEEKIEEFIDLGIVRIIEGEKKDFYGLTKDGVQFCADLGLMDDKNKWKRIYQDQDKPTDIVEDHIIERPEDAIIEWEERDLSKVLFAISKKV